MNKKHATQKTSVGINTEKNVGIITMDTENPEKQAKFIHKEQTKSTALLTEMKISN